MYLISRPREIASSKDAQTSKNALVIDAASCIAGQDRIRTEQRRGSIIKTPALAPCSIPRALKFTTFETIHLASKASYPTPTPFPSPTEPEMQFTTLLPAFALAFTTLAAPLEAPLETRHWGPAEYYSLGCPTNTTKPYASQYEQTKVLSTFADEVFVHQQVALGYDTYAAVNFINHAPEVSGNGTAIVIPFQTAELKGGSVEIKRVFVGTNLNGTSFGTIHFRGNSVAFGEGAIAGIWRMIGTCLVEYWDVASGVEASANPVAYF